MYRRLLAVAASIATTMAMSAAPALAAHDHYIVTPNGQCHQVAPGQTAIADESHGGHHRFHDNVHIGATARYNKTLGHGNARVEVYKNTADSPAPAICFGERS
ncbi:MAG: hypothetical protein HKO63_03475 [Acidimicrobiia bacterium]|nr:hypothetical protein [Acidimicrobiia bacterium]MBT8194323.1 hypothetical protein [Acidimicrobiia bacterium]MBT8247166.1 hypothetical protein [Acidimicrobiia bacterium]NNF89621.1 hypothetical protein [Acidimicrobiia bacterium]NNJ47731.1 hypothetical protein [Acidimicrobiia bacterium]